MEIEIRIQGLTSFLCDAGLDSQHRYGAFLWIRLHAAKEIIIPYSTQQPPTPVSRAERLTIDMDCCHRTRHAGIVHVVECVSSSLRTSFVVIGRILIPPLSINPPSSAQTEVIGAFLW